jgi:DNA repair photolyase
MRTTKEKWHGSVAPRNNVIAQFELDAKKLQGDLRPILFCFLTDPYQPIEQKERLTRQALEIVGKYKLKSKILTKGSNGIIGEDLDLMADIGTELGLTISFMDDEKRKAWEPFAAPIQDRLKTLTEAFEKGICTWVSLEPVIDPDEALALIEKYSKYVKLWKIGKLNHMKAVEDTVDWTKFLHAAESLLKSSGATYYIKNDLLKYN